MNTSFIRALLVSSSLATVASINLVAPAFAAETVLGGGSTLAEPAYHSVFGNGGTPNLSNFSYCGVGSGAGTSGFDANDKSKLFVSPAGTYDAAICANVASLTTFASPMAFGASDAVQSPAQISAYNTARLSKDGPLIQVPGMGTPITIPYVNATVKTDGGITLTDADLCGIYSGKVTNFISTNASSAYGSVAIHPAFRTDGSGTSFLLTQHLAAVCTAANSSITFVATTNFSSLFNNSVVPANFVGAKGSGGVQATITSGSANIGYLSPDYTDLYQFGAGYNPSVHVASLKNANNGVVYKPNQSNTQLALDTAKFVIPTTSVAAANPASWVPLIPNPSVGYPIVGYTNLNVATCYSTSATFGTDIANFLTKLYTDATTKSTISGEGLTPLVGTTLGKALEAVFVKNTTYSVAANTTYGPFNLNINSSYAAASACTGKAGRQNTN